MAGISADVAPSVAPTVTGGGEYQRIDAPAAAFGGIAAASQERLGRNIQQAADTSTNTAVLINERQNALAINDAFTAFQNGTLDITIGDPTDPAKKGYFSMQGREALDNARPTIDRVEQLRAQIRAGLQNDAQRLQFDTASRRLQSVNLERIATHAATEQRKDLVRTNVAAIDTQVRNAGAYFNNDAEFDGSLATARHHAADFAYEQLGRNADPAQVDTIVHDAEGKVVAGRLNRWSTTDPAGALRWLETGTVLARGSDLAGTPEAERKRIPISELLTPHAYQTLHDHIRARADASAVAGFAQEFTGRGGGGGSAQGSGQAASGAPVTVVGWPDGLVTEGNINLNARPQVRNSDGSVSTVRSMSFEEDGKHILIPTVVGNKVVSDEDAIKHYRATGQHLGIFDSADSATAYAKDLHEQQAAAMRTGPGGRIAPNSPAIPAPPPMPPGTDRAKYAFDYVVSQGFPPAAAAGVVANMRRESPTLDPGERHDGGIGLGILGWNGDRLKQLKSLYGPNPTFEQQLAFAVYELKGGGDEGAARAGQILSNPDITPGQAGADYSSIGIRPKEVNGNRAIRAQTAQQLHTELGGSQAQPAAANDTWDTPGITNASWDAEPTAATRAVGAPRPARNPQMFADEAAMLRDAQGAAEQRFPNRPDLQHLAVQAVYQQIVQTNALQAKYEAEQAKALRDAQEAAANQLVTTLQRDPQNFDPRTITENPTLTAEQKIHLMETARKTMNRDAGSGAATYGTGFNALYTRVTAPEGTLGRITDAHQLWAAMAAGELTPQGYEKVMTALVGRRTPEGEAINTLQHSLFATAKDQISTHRSDLGIRDPKGEELYMNFQYAVFQQIEAARAAGKPIMSLYNKDSPDYLGNLITQFKRTPAQIMVDQIAAAKAATAGGSTPAPAAAAVDLTTREGIMTAWNRGRISAEVAEKELLSRGFIRPEPAAAPPVAPPAGAGNLVPH